MTGLRRALLGLALAGVAFGALASALALGSDHADAPLRDALLGTFIGWSFIGTGLFAWLRRPANRVGALLCGVGFAWFLGSLYNADAPGVFITGLMLDSVWAAVLVWLLLAFPLGRLESRLDRGLVVGAFLLVTAGRIPGLLFLDFPLKDDCPDCPANPLLVADDIGVSDMLFGAVEVVAGVLLAIVVVRLVRRRRAAPPPQRRALGPILWAGVALMVVLGLQLSSDVAGFTRLTDALGLAGLVIFASVPLAFVAGLVGSRLSRAGAVGDLVERLRDAPHAGELRPALARALGDPSLTLAYWLPDRGAYVDAEGHPVALPEQPGPRAATEIQRDGRTVAAILHDAALCEEPELVRAAGAAAALALENERLDAELRARIDEVSASRVRILEAGDAERRRLERDLHDGAQQRLVALALALQMARGRVAADPAGADAILAGAQTELEHALGELRELARGIHPAVLVDRGLPAALEALAGRVPLPVEVEVPDERMPGPVEAAAYFVVSEALTNVSKYARAGSAQVRVERVDGHALVEVRDDGRGGADPARGTGLRGLADRVEALDGRLELHSPAGAGTVVRAVIPCA
jgi:signal transduction histidine kinase